MINFDNSASVKLKGVGDGFWITLDPGCPEDVLISEIDRLFQNLKQMVVGAGVVIDLGGAAGHDELIEQLRGYLTRTYDVARVTLPPEKRSIPTEKVRQRDLSRGWNHHRSDVLMLRGRVRSGQKIETRRHLIITGDVNPGSELCSGGDVIVLGKLCGKVHAGNPANNAAIIFALELKPTLLKIGEIAAAGVTDNPAERPEFACIEGNSITIKDYMKANPFKNIPWPQTM